MAQSTAAAAAAIEARRLLRLGAGTRDLPPPRGDPVDHRQRAVARLGHPPAHDRPHADWLPLTRTGFSNVDFLRVSQRQAAGLPARHGDRLSGDSALGSAGHEFIVGGMGSRATPP